MCIRDRYTTENGEYIQLDDIILSSEGDGSNLENTLDQMMTTASVIEYVAQGTYWTVSYTHLDVYKRQV